MQSVWVTMTPGTASGLVHWQEQHSHAQHVSGEGEKQCEHAAWPYWLCTWSCRTACIIITLMCASMACSLRPSGGPLPAAWYSTTMPARCIQQCGSEASRMLWSRNMQVVLQNLAHCRSLKHWGLTTTGLCTGTF